MKTAMPVLPLSRQHQLASRRLWETLDSIRYAVESRLYRLDPQRGTPHPLVGLAALVAGRLMYETALLPQAVT